METDLVEYVPLLSSVELSWYRTRRTTWSDGTDCTDCTPCTGDVQTTMNVVYGIWEPTTFVCCGGGGGGGGC
jgi:hypothetical protein